MGQSCRRVLVVAFASVVTASLVGCSGAAGTGGAVGTSGDSDAVAVAATSRGVTVENRSGRQLVDIVVSIRPGGSSPSFERTVPVLAAAERMELALTDFKTRDNVTLNPMFIRPREITVTAKDDAGEDYSLTVPWK